MTSIVSRTFDNLDRIVQQTRCARFLIGYSGGVDSSVLLRVSKEFVGSRAIALTAVHFDHGLQPQSSQWAEHCRRVCADVDVPLESVALDCGRRRGVGTEEWAREQRYRVLRSMVDPHTCVLTAHHLDDHIETLLHHALRGAGPHGLSGIRPLRPFGRGFLARPLIDCRGSEVRRYAEDHGLEWIDDPSNRDERYLRNAIRRRIVPVLEQAVPGAIVNLKHAASVQAGLSNAIDRSADRALDEAGCQPSQLCIPTLLGFEPEMRPFVLKRWLARAGAPVPGRRHIVQVLEHVVPARGDAVPRICWKGCELRRYRDRLYVMRALEERPGRDSMPWAATADLCLPWGRLSVRPARGEGLDPDAIAAAPVSVGFRTGGERCHPSARAHSQTLKRLFQEWQVPPWERDLTPLIFVGDRLAAVASHCICTGFDSPAGAVDLVWDLAIYRLGT